MWLEEMFFELGTGEYHVFHIITRLSLITSLSFNEYFNKAKYMHMCHSA